MTEYELATLAVEEMTLCAALLIGLGKIAIVWYGIRVLERDSQRRAWKQAQRHTEAMTAHTKAMTDLHELIARTTRTGGRA